MKAVLVISDATAYPGAWALLPVLGTVNAGRRDFEAALERGDHTIELNPHFAPAYWILGVIQEQRREFDEAVAAFQRAIALSPNAPRMYGALGRTLALSGARKGALGRVRTLQDHGAKAIVKGLRAISDFEYEFEMNQLNRKLAPDIESVYVMASPEYSFLSSTGVKELWKVKPGRFPLVHVKDMRDLRGAQEMVEVGTGDIDFGRIFSQAGRAGIVHYVVEHDNPADPMASVRTSCHFSARARRAWASTPSSTCTTTRRGCGRARRSARTSNTRSARASI